MAGARTRGAGGRAAVCVVCGRYCEGYCCCGCGCDFGFDWVWDRVWECACCGYSCHIPQSISFPSQLDGEEEEEVVHKSATASASAPANAPATRASTGPRNTRLQGSGSRPWRKRDWPYFWRLVGAILRSGIYPWAVVYLHAAAARSGSEAQEALHSYSSRMGGGGDDISNHRNMSNSPPYSHLRGLTSSSSSSDPLSPLPASSGVTADQDTYLPLRHVTHARARDVPNEISNPARLGAPAGGKVRCSLVAGFGGGGRGLDGEGPVRRRSGG